MAQPKDSSAPSMADRPVTWRDLAVCAHGALAAASLHTQVGWPVATSAMFGLTGPVLWALTRSR
ncbi:hypothetical protein OH807_30725 [Kitasatospora sp. NBC_01560]|uniref:hypothetical protein n=1 Tax=Kitasatospora sp. NBC_01560 TaxID=2975965 RepID=UPI003870ED34